MCTSVFTFTVFSLLGCSNIFLIILPIITLAFFLIHFQYRKMIFIKENMIVSSSCLVYVKVLKKKQTNKLFSPLLTAWLTLTFRSQISCGKPFPHSQQFIPATHSQSRLPSALVASITVIITCSPFVFLTSLYAPRRQGRDCLVLFAALFSALKTMRCAQ